MSEDDAEHYWGPQRTVLLQVRDYDDLPIPFFYFNHGQFRT